VPDPRLFGYPILRIGFCRAKTQEVNYGEYLKNEWRALSGVSDDCEHGPKMSTLQTEGAHHEERQDQGHVLGHRSGSDVCVHVNYYYYGAFGRLLEQRDLIKLWRPACNRSIQLSDNREKTIYTVSSAGRASDS